MWLESGDCIAKTENENLPVFTKIKKKKAQQFDRQESIHLMKTMIGQKHLIERLDQLSIPYDTWFLDTGLVTFKIHHQQAFSITGFCFVAHKDHCYVPELTSQYCPG